MIRVMDDAAEEAWLRLDRDVFMSSWYSQMYESHTYGGLAGIAQDWMHRSLERGYSHSTAFSRLLEVGGNVGEHVPFVKHAFDEYLLTDLHDSLSEEQRAKLAASSISFSTADVQALPWDPGTFDRVVNTCLLHHVPDPELALMEIRRVLKDGGRADIFLSSDPGGLFRLARAVGPARAARRDHLAKVKRLVDARDHRNHVGGLRRLVRHVFRHDRLEERTYPVPAMGWNLSMWHTFRITRVSRSVPIDGGADHAG